MTIQSLGAASGLNLDSLVKQILASERQPKQNRLDAREKTVESQLTGLGQLKSKMSDFETAVDELRNSDQLNGRSTTVTNPNDTVSPFTANASTSATAGEYKIAVTQLASGSRFETADASAGGFASNTDSVLSSGSGSLTFKVGANQSFTVNVTAGMTLDQLRTSINSNANNFGVNASIINTGTTSGGAKLVYSSTTTGSGNDLTVVNNNDLAELQRVSTTDSTETATGGAASGNNYLTASKSAQNAKVTIDGIAAESQTNEFKDVISNVTFDVSALSSQDSGGNPLTSTLKVGYDTEGVKKKITGFVDSYNALMDTINKLTEYGQSKLQSDGPLAGDFMTRGIQSSLASIVSDYVPQSTIGSLFKLGISFDDKNKLQISDSTKYGATSGQDRLATALSDNFDQISKLFTGDNGIATKLYNVTHQYTSYNGLLANREKSYNDEKSAIADDQARLDLQMASYEEVLRKKYQNLDQTVGQLNRTGTALMAALGQ